MTVERLRDATDEVRRRVSILEVVSPYVTLRRAGRSYKGLCPFHSEKTPSFTVDPERGFFYCFGCHAGGDVFDFVMRMGSQSFKDALKELADRAGVRLPQTPVEERRAGERERLLRAVAEAAAWFQAQLGGPAGAAAGQYLASRGVDAGTVAAFRLGYAPDGWDHLLRALRARGFDAPVLEQAGLVVARPGGDGHYDALRDRVVFPIHDLQGRPVAFGGRALGQGTPKYLNTRETPLFAKGKTLYALDAAREAIRDTDEAVVVEGYMDALSCHQFGIRNAVASLGTALTLDQVLLLKRFAARAVLVYDADAAGVDAAERSLILFDQAELPVRVAVLPGEADPDAFLRAHGPEALRRHLAGAQPIFEYRLAMAVRRHDPGTVEGKVGIVDELAQLIITVSHPVRQAEYVRVLAERLGVREDAIRGQLRRLGRRGDPGRPAAAETRPASEATARAGAERLLLHLMVADTAVRGAFRGTIDPGMFRDAGHRALAEALLAPDAPDADPGQLRERLRDETAVSLLSRFLIAEPPAGASPGGDRAHNAGALLRVAEECVRRIRRFALQERVDELLALLGDADRAGDPARVEALQTELREVYRELKVGV
jgi:DNA primase